MSYRYIYGQRETEKWLRFWLIYVFKRQQLMAIDLIENEHRASLDSVH